ncbi:MAG: aspartate-semialdehyde dehydrogenase [Chloracidobacterium sp.]|nr:aspartate-semialdehyde dehydrogenase [Chloracidobacterium sp.]
MSIDLKQSYDRLFAYCKREDFAGYDPFDGLNSVLFQITPLKHVRLARLALLQAVKRSPVNLRPILGVKKGVNPKGLALFALAELSRYRATNDAAYAATAKDLLERLMNIAIRGIAVDGQSTLAFGYNFNWQSRNFYAPLGTPAIVPTAFAQQALLEAYAAFGDEQFLKAAEEICSFILTGLNRSVETTDEICFSYTPLDRTEIYNASLLAGECLARIGALTQNAEYLGIAAKTARFVIRRQREDGAWTYGGNNIQAWVDNFHTAFILQSLQRILDCVPGVENETKPAIKRGTEYWLKNFFLDDGTPKYYDKSVYPVDIHSAAAAIAALSELSSGDNKMLDLAQKVAEWTLGNLCDPTGFFYYQRRQSGMVKTPFIRWGQAWMAYALARLIEARTSNSL